MATVLWADFVHQPLFQQTIREIIEPQIVADRIAPLEARIVELEKLVSYLRNPRPERDALAREAEAARAPDFQRQVGP